VPKAPLPIILDVGIALAGGAINEYLFLAGVTPPTATTSPRLRIAGVDIIAEATPARNDTVLGPGAANTINAAVTAIGHNVTAAGAGLPPAGVVLGDTVSFNGGGQEFTLIGRAIVAGASANVVVVGSLVNPPAGQLGGNVTVVGQKVNFNGLLSSDSTLVGEGISVSGPECAAFGSSIALGGADASSFGALSGAGVRSTTVGARSNTGTGGARDGIMIGSQASGAAGSVGAISLGDRSGASASVASAQMILGHQDDGQNVFTTDIRLGGGPRHKNATAAPALTVGFRDAGAGADLTAGDVTVSARVGTCDAVGAEIGWQTTIPGAAGAAQQTLAEVFRIAAGTAAQPRHVLLNTNKGLWFANQVTAAGGGAGTLLNAPAAGNPTFWVPVRVNGVDGAFPVW
jgi:hypothetical protein